MSLRAARQHLLGWTFTAVMGALMLLRGRMVGWMEFLPPIATDDYTLENLHERTAALREHFVAALARLAPEL